MLQPCSGLARFLATENLLWHFSGVKTRVETKSWHFLRGVSALKRLRIGALCPPVAASFTSSRRAVRWTCFAEGALGSVEAEKLVVGRSGW